MNNWYMKKIATMMAMILVINIGINGVSIKEVNADDRNDVSLNLTQEISAGDVFVDVPPVEETSTQDGQNEENSSSESDSEESSSEEPSSEEPSSEEPSTEEPSTEEPTSEEPTSEEPSTEEPTTEFEIVNEVYKLKSNVLVEYLGEKDNSEVKEITIPSQVEKIDAYVFENCKYIETVDFEDGTNLTEIGDYAFKKCTSLNKITLPQTLKVMGYKMLGECTALKSLTIPTSVEQGKSVLGTKSKVTKVTFSQGRTAIPDSILAEANSVKKVVLKTGIKTIGEKAFYKCSSLTDIELPSTVTNIKSSAFNGCSAITVIALPAGLTTIGKKAFKDCTALKKLKLKKKLTSIGSDAFTGSPNLILHVYANTTGKAYARTNKLNWVFESSEVKRQQKSEEIYKKFESLIGSTNKLKYKLKSLDNYVPQGLCRVKKYVIVSLYHKNMSKKSIILLYDKGTGKFVKKLYLQSVDHVGSITNVKDRLVVGINNVSATDYLGVISYSSLKKAKKNSTIKYKYKIKIPGYADFAAYDGKLFWAGRSDNVTNAKMYGYKVSVKNGSLKFTQKYSYLVPKNCQGLIAIRSGSSKRTFIISQSYGLLADSSIITYKVNLKKNKELGNPKSTKLAPSMIEGIFKSGNYVYIVFESAAGKYCGDPDYTTEIQVKRVCKIKYTNLQKLPDK